MMNEDIKAQILSRLKKIEGQVGGVRRMIEKDKYCIDVLLQLSAVEGAIDRVGQMVLTSHVETCVQHAIEGGDPNEIKQKFGELINIMARFSKLSA